MNDFFNNKNSKVRVMYVRNEAGSDEPRQKSRTSSRQKGKFKEAPYRTERGERRASVDRSDSSPSNDPHEVDSPWKAFSRRHKGDKAEHLGICGNSAIDPGQLRRQRAEESRVYGENACIALFASRREAIVRAWFLQTVTPRFRETLRWLAANRRAYHVIDEQEMEKVSGTEHHGGVCFLIKKRDSVEVSGYLTQAMGRQKDCVLALEAVNNPHNAGGIMRTCAHFGVTGVLLSDPAVLESGAAVRTAEGGAEYIQPIVAKDFDQALDEFRGAGYQIVTTSSHHYPQSKLLAQVSLPKKLLLLLGNEGEGLSTQMIQQSDMVLAVGGTGQVESLNVSVATGILLAEWWRQHAQRS